MKIIKLLYNRLHDFLQLLYPPVCLGCQTAIEKETELQILCERCLHSLKRIRENYIEEEVLGRLEPCYLDTIVTAFEFDQTIQILIHEIKYRRAKRLAFRLANFAYKQLDVSPPWQIGDLVVPIPLYRVREKERGFNQSSAIAAGFFPDSNYAHHTQIVLRAKSTLSQTELNREERLKNVHQAFNVTQPELVQNKNIILVDDVVTTGATLNECAYVLRKAGAENVWGLTLTTPVEHL
jgi:ComF family protein